MPHPSTKRSLAFIEEARARREAERNRLKPPSYTPSLQDLSRGVLPVAAPPQATGIVIVAWILVRASKLLKRIATRLDQAASSLKPSEKPEPQDSEPP